MNLRYVKTIVNSTDQPSRITALCWSPNNQKLAICGSDKIVSLFDDNGVRQDKFPTKPADPKTKNYVVRAMAFSPDSTKIAVAQTDGIVFVYKLGTKWGEKKSICNKFPLNTAVTCLVWPNSRQNDVVFGMADGKVKIGSVRHNKLQTAHSGDTYVVSIACSPDGNSILSGHVDGSIYLFSFAQSAKLKFVQHSSVPQALAWGEHVVVGGTDSKVVFYDLDGLVVQKCDYSQEDQEKEYICASCSPSGQSVVLGSFNRFRVYSYSIHRQTWEEGPVVATPNVYTLNCVSWKRDGSRLAVGSLCGGVFLYDACIKRYRYKNKFEMTYVSPSQVIIKRLATGSRIVLSSMFPYEIVKLNVYQDQFVIGNTEETLLMADLQTNMISEIPWQGSGNEKFIFDNPKVCMIYNAGELTLVETEHVSSHLISVRLNERKVEAPPASSENGEANADAPAPTPVNGNSSHKASSKKIAYLIDLQTVKIDDLETGLTLATINHDDSKIDWLELNGRATKLLFRDKKRVLYLFDISTQQIITLLNYCSYVQWVPESDVVVAQNRGNLCVWYSIEAPERVTMFPIKGDVVDIERANGKTEVVVDEGINTVYLSLNESLIAFSSALEDRNYIGAAAILEGLGANAAAGPGTTPGGESDGMWTQLGQAALEAGYLRIAERCYAALGDVARARYLRKTHRIAEMAGNGNAQEGMSHYIVRAKLAVLGKQFKQAEMAYLEQGQVQDAMDMYQELHKWDESIAVAEARSHPEVQTLRRNYLQWLIQSNQEEKAAQLKEREGDYQQAVELYLKGGLPAKAAHLVIQYNYTGNYELLERIAQALSKAGLYEKAGLFFEKLNSSDRALEAYRKGHSYRHAVELCRSAYPGKVVQLEEEWGEWLVVQKQMDSAINHFIEAGKFERAVESAMESKQWAKAVQIVDNLEPDVGKKFYKRIARHYEDSLNFEFAERYYVKGGYSQDAVDMYTKVNMWEAAHTIAVTYMGKAEITLLYVNQAQKFEAQGRLKESEKLYLTVNEPDLAINMYKKHKLYDHMIRLVASFHKDYLQQTHLHLAQQLETEGSFKLAEKHYVEANEWKTAVEMYRANDMWEEALRLAKQMGGNSAYTQVAIVWARTVRGEAGVNLLMRLTLLEQALDLALELDLYGKAEEVAKQHFKKRLPDVYFKHAVALEEEGRFTEAEEEFIKAGKPKEAIGIFCFSECLFGRMGYDLYQDMYLHQRDWLSATRVAEAFEPAGLLEVFEAQGRVALEEKDYPRAEAFFVKARKPELAVQMYKELRMVNDVLRVTKEHMAHRLGDISDELLRNRELSAAELLIQNGSYSKAIDAYLKMTAEDSENLDELEGHWEHAVRLAMEHVRDRVPEVVTAVSKRLVAVKKYTQAAELLEGIDAHKEAIDVYVQAEMWEQARRLALQKAPEFGDLVSHKKLTYYAERGEWDRCLEIAQQLSPEMVAKYAGLHANQLVESKKFAEAIEAFAKYGSNNVPLPSNIPIPPSFVTLILSTYRSLIKEVLAEDETSDLSKEKYPRGNLTTELREMLFQLVAGLKSSPTATEQMVKEFEKYAYIAHFNHQRILCQQTDLKEIEAKLAVALVRYSGDIPADKAFYHAGMSCKAVGWTNMAFVFLNRFLDLAEMMEEGETGLLENSDFEGTDIPFNIPLPSKHFLSEEKREEVRNWVLAASLDTSMDQTLSMRQCEQCDSEVYVASLSCSCKAEFPPCVISGFPVLPSTKTSCKSCGKYANKEEWNKYLIKTKSCPWCGNLQSPNY